MSNGISFSGLSSGLDTDGIITALVKAESTRKTALGTKQNTLKLRQAAYATIKTGMSAVARAAGTLNTVSAFSTMKASVGDEDVATVSAASTAAAGSFDLDVATLARANKVGSAAQADTTTALGKTGAASVNGKAFRIESGDSLVNVAQKINGLGAGVTASVVDGGAGKAYLTVSSGTTGAANAVSLADLDGTAFADLGLVGSGATIRQTVGASAVSRGFSSSSTALGSLLGATGLSPSTITIGGTAIAVDPTTDTLDDLASKINAAGISGVSATVAVDVKDGVTTYSLGIAGSGTPPTISESGGLLRGLGVLRATPGNELVVGRDAAFTLDGVALTSPTNTVTGIVSGATVTLKSVGETSLTLAKDTSAIKDNVTALVSSVNDLLSAIAAQSTFDKSTYQSGILFGDSVARQAKESVRSLLFTDSPGVTGTLKNLASIGFGLNEDGSVKMDDAVFNKALESDPAGVAALFQSVGKGSVGTIKYVSSTNVAAASSGAGYAVNVTQPATRGSLVAGTASTGPRTAAETLTFRGAGFGSSGIAVGFDAGTDLAATVSKINADGRLKDLVSASVENGKLRIDSKKYGAAGNFTLTSNFASSTTNSGIGLGGEGTSVLGLDVAGTIGGEPATGNGQFLTGTTGNAHTEGLQILVSATSAGLAGTLSFSRGAASRMQSLLSTFTDTATGTISAADKSLDTQIDGLDKDMATITARIASKTAELKARFSAMEDAISKLKSQSSTLSSLLSSNSSSS